MENKKHCKSQRQDSGLPWRVTGLNGLFLAGSPTHFVFSTIVGAVFSPQQKLGLCATSSPCSCVLLPPPFPTFFLQASTLTCILIHTASVSGDGWLSS